MHRFMAATTVRKAPEPVNPRVAQLQGDIPWEGRSFIVRRATYAINSLFFRHCGGRHRPAFYDIDATYPALRVLDANVAVIRAEVDRLLPHCARLPNYHNVDKAQTYISTAGPGNWKVFLLSAMGQKFPHNRALCPQTSELLDGISTLR